jgi:hypothetical protein
MKIDPENSQDAHGSYLQEWRVNAPLPPRFQEQVWRRIEHEEPEMSASAWTILQRLFENAFAHRRIALAYLTLALLVGSVAGYWQGREQASGQESNLSRQYIQSVDPYQKHGEL